MMIPNRESELLVILQEESAEVIQAVSKIFRFGKTDRNMQNLHAEIGDLLCVLNLLLDDRFFNSDKIEQSAKDKKKRLKKYMKHQKTK